jgi:hypothetical protein
MDAPATDGASLARDGAFPGGRRGWWIAVLAIVLLVSTRARACWFSYGLDAYADEPAVVEPALAAARGDLRPVEFLYPGWTAYTIGAVYRGLDLVGFGGEAGFVPASATADHLVVARLVVFATALATIVVAALIARRLVGPWAGVAAAALLACSPVFTSQSYFAAVNPPAGLWTALAILFAARVYVLGRRPADYLISGLCAGLAVGCKYNSYPAALPLAVAHLFAPRAPDGRRHGWMVAGWALVPAAFFATTPYALIDFPRFMDSVRFLGDIYETDWPKHYEGSGTSHLAYVERMVRFGWPDEMSLLAGLGIVALTWRDWRRSLLLAVAPLANWLFLGMYPVFFLRHLLPALPVLAVFSGAAVQAAADGIEARRRATRSGRSALATALACLLVAAAGARSLADSQKRIGRTDLVDSREAALEWVLANLPEGARIVREDRTPEIEKHTGRFQVRYVRSLVRPDRTREIEAEADYVVLTDQFLKIAAKEPGFARELEAFQAFRSRHSLIAEFRGNGEEFYGRDIWVYRIDAVMPPPQDTSNRDR